LRKILVFRIHFRYYFKNKITVIQKFYAEKSCLAVAKEMGQRLKWMVAQSPNATNILFGRPKAAPN
jgi:hypothetical protein